MAASERAKQLIVAYGNAWLICGQSPSDATVSATIIAGDALLAYVARLEACVAAAREACVEFPRGISHATIYRNGKLIEALAALDRPEDGE